MTPDQVSAILAPLEGICRRRRLSFDWRTYREGAIWRAEMRAGHSPEYGARPCWTGIAEGEPEALRSAASGAIYFWDDQAQSGVSRTLLDLIYSGGGLPQ